MTYLLFPGRHLLHTTFQQQYLHSLLQVPLDQLPFLDGHKPDTNTPIDQIIFPVTSCNQQHTRYTPIPFHVRAIGLDRFARPLEMAFGVRYRIIGIPHYRPTPRFAEFILKEIEEQTEGRLRLTPENCVVLCSTPGVIALFRKLGFAILPAELGTNDGKQTFQVSETGKVSPSTPTELMRQFVSAGENWFTDPDLRRQLAPTTFDLWQDFPDIPRRVLRLWRDPLLNEDGGLTEQRDYNVYAYGMGNREIIRLKYNDIKHAILPGKIVDEGCADGALLSLIARDFPDSDLIGIEITGEFLARALERQRMGDFGEAYIHFHQRNITHPIFEPNSIDTTVCNSTVHELWSYGEGEATVRDYFAKKYAQTAKGGRLIIRDVVGPPDKIQTVIMRLNHKDGSNEDILRLFESAKQLSAHLASLSTYARFIRFAQDFHQPLSYEERTISGDKCVVLSLQSAVEFMTKKDYVENWGSEMQEAFAFWDFAEWKGALNAAGFTVVENPNAPDFGSRTYTNEWIVSNRWEGKVALYTEENSKLTQLPNPPTNIILIGQK